MTPFFRISFRVRYETEQLQSDMWRLGRDEILISLIDINIGLVMGMLPKRIAFGGNLARDAAQTEPFNVLLRY